MPRFDCGKCGVEYQSPYKTKIHICAFCSSHTSIDKNRFKICPVCKHEFYLYSTDQDRGSDNICCSYKCRKIYVELGKRFIECKLCNKRFYNCKSLGHNYCSWKCMTIDDSINRICVCITCKKLFLKRPGRSGLYCSQKCVLITNSVLEQRFEDLIKDKNIDLFRSSQIDFKIGRFHPDFINFNKKVIVEINGCYWHGCNICFNSKRKGMSEEKIKKVLDKDIRKLKLYKDKEYDVFVIWGHDFNHIYKKLEEIQEMLNLKNLVVY